MPHPDSRAFDPDGPPPGRTAPGPAATTRAALLTGVLLAACAPLARADLDVRFVESAPKDRFELTNVGTCALEGARLRLDLSGSAGRLIFDTSAEGAGVEVHQPFEIDSGAIALAQDADVKDGDVELVLSIAELMPGESASFTMDLDDTLPEGELGMIRVTGAEIERASLVLETAGERGEAEFGPDARARVPMVACPSP